MNKIIYLSICYCTVLLTTFNVSAQKDEVISTSTDQTHLAITIYNNDLGLVRDQRNIQLKSGMQTLAFKDVSARIRPETALFHAPNMQLLEQNFEYDLLTNESLLNKYIGKEVKLLLTNKATGEEQIKSAVLLSNNNGNPIFKIGDQITPMRSNMSVIYDHVPENLRDQPTLTMLLNGRKATKEPVELTYLTNGLSWQADYVVNIIDDKKLNLQGWVTLKNQTETAYKNAQLQLVAGDVNQVSHPTGRQSDNEPVMYKTLTATKVQQEAFMDYHLYTMPNRTNIDNNQTKQIALLQAQDITYHHDYIVSNNSQMFYQYRQGTLSDYQVSQKYPVNSYIYIENKKENHLGIPLPKGIIRTYKQDSHQQAQFAGEDSIEHTPENQTITLLLGKAFDLTATTKVVDYSYRGGVLTLGYDVALANAKDKTETIKVRDQFYGDWQIAKESQPSTKLNGFLQEWAVSVPAKSTVHLTYTVNFYFNKNK